MRRATKPLREEVANERERLEGGTDDWLRWWRTGGERELRCILMTAWDPIGVSYAVEAWDEYDDYASGVARRLREAKDPEEAMERVAEYLDHVERDFMEALTSERSRANSDLAESLAAWYEWSFARGGRPVHEWKDA